VSLSILPGAQGGSLRLADGARMDWLQLGVGSLPVVVVPGAGDGLWTVKQTALLLAWRYRRRFHSQRLLVLGRREPIPPGFGAKEHAEDYAEAVDRLGWGPSVWECVSAGGPIGQWAALCRPDLIRGLILASSMHRADETLRSVLTCWLDLVRDRRWADLYWSIAVLNRRPAQLARYRSLRPFLRLVPAPRSPERFVNLLDGLMHLDNSTIAPKVGCPVLVVGGEEDRIITAAVQRKMAALIPNSRLVLYGGYGHAAPLEHPEYERTTRHFIEETCR
jgi:pimeloyl-ACP methyl ester carboxylesterase